VALAGASYLPFKNLLTAVAPDFLGNPATYNYFGKGFYDSFYFFAGTGAILLLFLSITQIKKEKKYFILDRMSTSFFNNGLR